MKSRKTSSFPLYLKKHLKKDLPLRKLTDHKGAGGKCLIFAGSKGMWGAAILCATAAARVGAGYVYLNDLRDEKITLRHPDFLLLSEDQDQNLTSFSSVAIGPGLKMKSQIFFKYLNSCRTKNIPVVLDAEALNMLSQRDKKNWKSIPSHWILTPHEGELARLLGVSASKIKTDREKYVRLAQKKFGCVVVLKGHHTLIASSDEVREIPTGNPSLSKAGTGDVLTGMIAGFLSQGISPLKSACLAAYIHGSIADEWIKTKDILSLMASDLVRELPEALFRLRK